MKAATALLCVSLAASSPAFGQSDITQQYAFTIGNWSGMRYSSPDGKTISCGATTSASPKDGLAINLALTGLLISISREGWKFPRKFVEVDLAIDDVTVATSAEGLGGNVLRILFTPPDDVAVFKRLRSGSLMRINTKAGSQTYALTGLAEAMPALTRCMEGPPVAAGQAPPAPVRPDASDPFDVPGATRLDRSEVMAVMANTTSKKDDPRPTFLLAKELAAVLPGFDVGWRDDTGVLVGTAVRGKVGQSGVDTIVGNLIGRDIARCGGKMRIEITARNKTEKAVSTKIHGYCEGGGNGKEAHYLVYAFDKGGVMLVRLEPVTMTDPGQLVRDLYED